MNIEGAEDFQQAVSRFDLAMQRHVHRQLVSWAADVKASVRKLVPVRTGYLRNTIYAEITEWVAAIGADAAYALFVEFGTRYMQAQPYLYPAILEHLPRLERIILDALDAAKSEAGLQ
jgi:HK97 gp10 family phage protein